MTEPHRDKLPRLGISLEEKRFSLIPGKSLDIQVRIQNQGHSEDDIGISVRGILTSWVSTATPVFRLFPGEEKEITLTIQPPPTQRAGRYPFTITATSQTEPSEKAEVDCEITIAAFQVQGRIGVLLESTQFSVAPGSNVDISVILLNQGLEEDYFKLSIEGIPSNWVSTPTPVIRLSPGEQEEVILTIHPPRSFQSRAGRNPIKLFVTSHEAPDQSVEVSITLTISTFTQFSSELQPRKFAANQNNEIVLKNFGNIHQTYKLTWFSEGDDLEFEPGTSQDLKIPAGQTLKAGFSAAPKRRPIIGGDVLFPFTVQIQSAEQETQVVNGEVSSKGLIPIWLIPIIISICLSIVCVSTYFFTQNAQNSRATQTAEANMTEVAFLTDVAGTIHPTVIIPTEVPPDLPTEVPTDLPPLPTLEPTPVPPSETPHPPTEVPTEIPSEEPTEVPTEGPPPIQGLGKIAYESNRDGNPEIYILNTDDLSTSQITIDPAVDTQPAWSPNGNRLAFISNRDGNNEIYIMNTDGTAVTNLTNNPADDQYPTWSPDGEWIAFQTNRDGNLEVYKIRADGSEENNISNNPAEDYHPNWFEEKGVLLSQGDWITFTSNRDGNQEIYIMQSDGSEQTNISNNPSNDFQPSGSPSGGRIAFTSNRDGNQEIYLMFADGTEQVNVTQNPAEDYLSTWAPDGNWVAFTSNRDGNQEIYVSHSDGSNLYNITSHPAEDTFPAWR